MNCLILDNYDSFVYNLRQILSELGVDADVYRNDKITLDQVAEYDKIILSPGPGLPSEAGLLLPLIKRYAPVKSILGISLGALAIGEAFGARLLNLKEVYHGVCSDIRILVKDPLFNGLEQTPPLKGARGMSVKDPLFNGLEPGFRAGLYHSFVISKDNLPECIAVTAVDGEAGYIMGVRHRLYDVKGIQFHPESVLTPQGKKIIENWINN